MPQSTDDLIREIMGAVARLSSNMERSAMEENVEKLKAYYEGVSMEMQLLNTALSLLKKK
jgi:hypothetical protein